MSDKTFEALLADYQRRGRRMEDLEELCRDMYAHLDRVGEGDKSGTSHARPYSRRMRDLGASGKMGTMSKTTIKVFAIEGVGIGGDWLGAAFVDDMGVIASHSCSSAMFVPHDMGITSDWKHDVYDRHFPGGWELELLGKVTLGEFERYAKEHGVEGKAEGGTR